MSGSEVPDPDEYVRQHKDSLVRVIKHSNDEFTRALCLAALVEYGDDPAQEVLAEEIADLDDFEES